MTRPIHHVAGAARQSWQRRDTSPAFSLIYPIPFPTIAPQIGDHDPQRKAVGSSGDVMENASHLVASFEPFIRHYGVFAVTLILAAEAIGLPAPGESLLIFSSVLAARGEMSLLALVVFAWAGAVMGDNIGYAIGRSFGRGVILRYGARIGLTDARFNSIESVFRRYGSATVMFARFFAILRQLNGIVAGILGMSWWRFLLFNALGGALWVITWVFAGYYLTEHMSVITGLAHHTKIVAGVLAVGILVFVVFKSAGPALRRARRDLWG